MFSAFYNDGLLLCAGHPSLCCNITLFPIRCKILFKTHLLYQKCYDIICKIPNGLYPALLEMPKMLTEKEVEYVTAVAECLNITRAAEKLHIAQPALSRALRRIETEIGVQLFDRTTTPLSLTHAGNRYLIYARKYQSLLSQMQHEFTKISKQEQGKLFLGIPSQIANFIFPQNVSEFQNKYPSIDVAMKYGSTQLLSEMLKKEKIDASILSAPLNRRDFVNDIIAYDLILFAVPPAFDCGNSIRTSPYDGIYYVDIDQISTERFYITEYFYQSSLAPLLESLGIHLPRVTYVPTLNVGLELAANGSGIAVIMQSLLHHAVSPSQLRYCTVNVPESVMHYTLTFRKSVYDSKKGLALFVDYCRNSFSKTNI